MTRLNVAFHRALDTNADPVNGGKLWVYTAGTTTPVITYSDAALTIVQAHPVVADSDGLFDDIFVPNGAYKVRVTDEDDVLLYESDNVIYADSEAAVEYANVADALADTTLVDGAVIRTQGYTNAGDGGGADYLVMTELAYGALTDTPDEPNGYVDHELANGLVARLLHSGTIAAEQAGAVSGVEASAQIQAAWDALALWRNANTDIGGSWLTHKSSVTIQNQVSFSDDGSVCPDGMNFDLRGSVWTGVSGGDLADDNAILYVRCPRAVQKHGKIEGGEAYAGLDLRNNAGARVFYPEIKRYKGIGIRVRGSSGSMAMYAPQVSEYTQDDDDYTTQSNFTGTAFSVETGDFNVYNANILFNNIGVYLNEDAVQVHFVEPHIVMGNAVEGAGNPFVDGILVENHATRENHFDAPYFDNGVVDDYGGTLNISGGHYVYNGAATITEPKIRIYPTSAGQDLPTELRINNIGGLATVNFVDDGANTWTGDWATLAGQYTTMAEEDRQVSYRQTQFNIFPNNAAKVEYNYKPDGNFLREYAYGSDTLGMQYLPDPGELRINGSSDAAPDNPNTVILRKTGDDRYRIWHASRDDLVTWAGSNTPDVGTVVCADEIWYQYDGSETAITDMTGWRPYGAIYPDHFLDNATPGSTDMGPAIEAAAHINGTSGSSSSTGHTVYLKAERYAHSAITITRDAVRLKGSGKQATRMQYLSATGDGITMGDDSSKMFRPGIEDMSVGMAAGVEKTSGAHIKVVRGRGGSLTGLEIDDFFDGVTLEGSDRCMVYDVTGTNLNRTLKAGKFFSQLYHSASGEKCTDNKFTLIRTAASSIDGDAAMYIESADGCHIVGAELNNYDYAIHIHTDTSNPTIGGLMCSNTYFDESNVSNMLVDGDGTFQNAKFTGCYFRKSEEDGLRVAADVTVDGCLFTGSSFETGEEMAVNWIAQDSASVMFSGCLFDDNLRDDTTTTEVYYNGDNLTMTGCNFNGGWASGVCITLGANSSNCLVVPNNFLATTNGTTITDNGSGNTVS